MTEKVQTSPAEGQSWSAEGYVTHASFVPQLGARVLDLLAPRPGEQILDLGCGDGKLTLKIAEQGALVVGVDSSPELLASAQGAGLNVSQMDGQSLTFNHEFDAVFTNAALHWMPDLDSVLGGVQRALRARGRFVGEFGGHGNVAAIVTALRGALALKGLAGPDRFPWVFPTVERFRRLLECHNFDVGMIELEPRPTPLPTGVSGWLETFAGPFLHGLGEGEREGVITETLRLLEPSLCDDEGRWTADYVRLRFTATLRD